MLPNPMVVIVLKEKKRPWMKDLWAFQGYFCALIHNGGKVTGYG
jgi:hypothetical protein